MNNRIKRLLYLHWLPMWKIVVFNLLPLLFITVCVFLFIPADERPVFWGFIALVSLGWALLIWGSVAVITIYTYTVGALLKALGDLFSSPED